MPRRVIICRIDPETDQPFARQFDMDPLQWVLDHRVEMVAAACVLIRARFTHAQKRAPGRLASFEAWDDLVRQTVCWADSALRPHEFGDPMDLVREAQAADPEADPARWPADGGRRNLAAVPQGDGAGVHAASRPWFRRADAGPVQRLCQPL